MLKNFYREYIRVFVVFGLLAIAGIYLGFKLPISLYPQTSKPVVRMNVSYAGLSMKEYIKKYGANFETQLEGIKNTGLKISEVKAEYYDVSAMYTIIFDWNTPFEQSLKEVQNVANQLKGILPKESADSIGVWQWSSNAGFLAVSFYSHQHSTEELYKLLNPLFFPQLRNLPDTENASLWNPEAQEVSIKLKPEKMIHYDLMPSDVYATIERGLVGMSGGKIINGEQLQTFEIPEFVDSVESLNQLIIVNKNGVKIHLQDIASTTVGKAERQNRYFKTDGKASLILFANPKSGSNVKRMAEDILEVIKKNESKFPPGVEYKILVDPSEFIRSSISGLMKEVLVAALLAVLVLYLFMGQMRNVMTAAIEIPLSMVIAFIVMYFMDMNLNLISLGGLALAAGMNVDASVVVLENIFRKQKEVKGSDSWSFSERLDFITEAVQEVWLPVVLSTLASLIVFAPLVMTKDLTQAILGDLAKAVVFSHGVSGFVAIFLVPPIRLFLIKKLPPVEQTAPLEPFIHKLEKMYLRLVYRLMNLPKVRGVIILATVLLTWASIALILPRLPKEVIGTPDTDWLVLNLYVPQSQDVRRVENLLEEHEREAVELLEGAVAYTFVQGNGEKDGTIMLRLHDKRLMKSLTEKLQNKFRNTPEIYYYVGNWNPAELPLPEISHFEVELKSQDSDELLLVASRLKHFMNEYGGYDRMQIKPSLETTPAFSFKPYEDIWAGLTPNESSSALRSILDLTFYAQGGKKPGSFLSEGELIPINVFFETKELGQPDNIKAYPLRVNGKIIPLAALGEFSLEPTVTQVLRQDGTEKFWLSANLDQNHEREWEAYFVKNKSALQKAKKEIIGHTSVQMDILPAQKELISALEQIKFSLIFSLALVFLVLWFQFKSIKDVLVIMITIPFGLIGVLISLELMGSTLSLNSCLGIILLNGIAVNNSILIVEFFHLQKRRGFSETDAILSASALRLRPILITSLTTILGMFPIALGLGDGGKILQPLGISVVGGLFVSMTLTIIFVPCLLRTSKKEDRFTETERYSENGIRPWQ
jgi:hydrophobic/amphiphilic exporter-1 (mainly G- bacteria), HAE1 family